MKIVQLIYSLASGGAERFVVSLSNQLADMGHDVVLCMLLPESESYSFNKQFLNENVKLHSMQFTTGFSLRKIRDLEKFILSENPDVVHCHLNVIPYVFRLACIHKRIKFVHTLHNIAENTSSNKIQRYINKFFYKYKLIIPVTISQECQISYEKYYNLKNALCVYNGCEIPTHSSNYQDVISEVESYKKDVNTKVFIHVARFHPQKNQQLLVDAFNQLHKLGYDFVLIILGGGFDKDGKELIKESCNKIHYLGLKNNVSDYLSCADAFCLTSIYEGLPISLLEAISCGVVPICTKVGGIPDVVNSSSIGLLSDDVSSDSYVSILIQYLSGQEEFSREELKCYFNNNFSMRTCALRYLGIFKGSI